MNVTPLVAPDLLASHLRGPHGAGPGLPRPDTAPARAGSHVAAPAPATGRSAAGLVAGCKAERRLLLRVPMRIGATVSVPVLAGMVAGPDRSAGHRLHHRQTG